MGVMARRTVRLSHRVGHMLFGEGGAVGLMTLRAEGNEIIFQKMVRLGGAMRVMAVQAPFRYRAVLEFNLRDGNP